MDKIQLTLLEQVADLHEVPEGAYNLRINGALGGRNTTANIDIVPKEDVSGIDIIIKPHTKNESVHIPVKTDGKIRYTVPQVVTQKKDISVFFTPYGDFV